MEVAEAVLSTRIDVKCQLIGILFECDENDGHKWEGEGKPGIMDRGHNAIDASSLLRCIFFT